MTTNTTTNTTTKSAFESATEHVEGSHKNDEQFDCHLCYPWSNGYGARVLASLSANVPDLDAQWWHSGGGIMGIHIDHKGKNYFVGAADEPQVGMDILDSEDNNLGFGDFGSEEDCTPSDMAKKIWDGIENGKGVTLQEQQVPCEADLNGIHRCPCDDCLVFQTDTPTRYTVEDVPTVLRRMFSDAIKLSESWDADGNHDLNEFESGKFITESLDEWAHNFSALADEYEGSSD